MHNVQKLEVHLLADPFSGQCEYIEYHCEQALYEQL